ncbi:SIR2 family NAD-dependent protein deacylase [Sorangium sp. So ce861]|uniref:SIR2 family NAD-dependent protein deacylase n=1 Tax=Sorangium sp. So ce861 TaxID=3133323 RepID=UPI003F5DCF90
MGSFTEEIRREIAKGRAACIVGAGVSIAATFDPERRPDFAGWLGLLEHGASECERLYPDLRASKWLDIVRAEIASKETDNLLSAAEKISRKLGGPGGGDFRRWLRETVGSLRIRNPRVPEALRALGLPLLTTNYDDVLEQATGRRPITWRDAPDFERVLRGDDDAVVHLHGHWRRPETVVLGVRSYEDLLRDEAAQALERALRALHTLIFVGFGAGLDDPNLGALLQWSGRVFRGAEYRNYVLVLDHEELTVQAQHPPERRLFVQPYGATFADLGPYLESLVPPDS